MSLFSNMFGGNPATSAAPAAPVTPPPAAENPTVPTTQNTPPSSPLDKFQDLWKPSESGSKEPLQFNADPAKLMEAAKGIDFTTVVPKEVFAAVAKGGEEGMAAMVQAMNLTAQAGYAQSAQATTAIVQKALEMQQERFMEQLPGIIKQHSVSETMATHPLLSNPATKPIMEAMKSQMAAKFPEASAAEIAKYTNEYLTEFANLVSSQSASASPGGKTKTKEFDWAANFFDLSK